MNNTKSENLKISQGESLTFSFEFEDLSAFASAKMQVRKGYNDEDVLFTLSTSRNTVAIDGNKLILSILPEVTEAVQFNGRVLDGVYDLELTNVDGTTFIALRGTLELIKNVTRSGVVIRPEDLNLDNDESLIGQVVKIDTGVYTTRELLIDSVTEGLSITNGNGVQANPTITFDINPIIQDLTTDIEENANDIDELENDILDFRTDFEDTINLINTNIQSNEDARDIKDSEQDDSLTAEEAARISDVSDLNDLITTNEENRNNLRDADLLNQDNVDTAQNSRMQAIEDTAVLNETNRDDQRTQDLTDIQTNLDNVENTINSSIQSNEDDRDAETAQNLIDIQTSLDTEVSDLTTIITDNEATRASERASDLQNISNDFSSVNDVIVANETARDAQRVLDQEFQANNNADQFVANALVQTNLDNYRTANDLDLASETTSRENADVVLQDNINDLTASTEAAAQAETTARETAIQVETTARENADNSIISRLDSNELALNTQRTNDLAAQTAVNSSQDDATALVQTNLDGYVSSNNQALQSLTDDLQSETQTRSEQDDLINTRIDDAEAAQTAYETSNDTAVSVERGRIDDLIISNSEESVRVDTLVSETENALQVNIDALNGVVSDNKTEQATFNSTETARVDSEIVRIDADIDTKVSLTGDESISGHKTFVGDVTVEGLATLNNVIIKSQNELDVGDAVVLLNAEETGSPTIDAGIEIQRGTETNSQLVFDESEDLWSAGLVGALQPIVLDNDPRLTNDRAALAHTHVLADITDYDSSVFATAAQGLLADSALQDISDSQLSELNNVSDIEAVEGQVLTFSATDGWHPQTNTSGVTDHSLLSNLDADDHPHYLNQERADDLFLSLNGGDVGNINIINPTGTSALIITNESGIGNSQIQLRDESGATNANIVGTDTLMILSHINSVVGQPATVLTLTDDAISSTKPVVGIQTLETDGNLTLTSKGYVDDLNNTRLSLDGGTLTDSLTIGKDDGSPTLVLDTTGTIGNEQIVFRRQGVLETLILSSATRYFVRRGSNEFSVFEEFSNFNNPVRGVTTIDTDSPLTLITKDFAEDTFLSKNGGTINAALIIEATTAGSQLVLDNTGGGSAFASLRTDGVANGQILSSVGATTLRHLNTNGGTSIQLALRDNDALINGELLSTVPTSSTSDVRSYTTKDYVDDSVGNGSVINQDNVYKVVMPNTAPTSQFPNGDTSRAWCLGVQGISGDVLTLQWVNVPNS